VHTRLGNRPAALGFSADTSADAFERQSTHDYLAVRAINRGPCKTITEAKPRQPVRLLGSLSVNKKVGSPHQSARARSRKSRLNAEGDARLRAEFCDHIREVALTERRAYDGQIALVQMEERQAAVLSFAAAVFALVLFAVGASLMLFSPQMTTLTTVSGLFGLLSGGATALLRRHVSSSRARRKEIEDRQIESRNTALAIQVALSHTDQLKRSTELVRVTNLVIARRVTQPRVSSNDRSPKSARKRRRSRR